MLNFEKYKDEILKITEEDGDFAFDKKTNKICRCNGMSCVNCKFDNEYCNVIKLKWLYKEPIKLTQFEYDLLSIEYDRYYCPSEWKAYMKEWWNRGYLLSLKDLDMTIGDILDNCEVIEDE